MSNEYDLRIEKLKELESRIGARSIVSDYADRSQCAVDNVQYGYNIEEGIITIKCVLSFDASLV